MYYDYEELEFEWDDRKEAINILKHKVSFEEASKVFFDSLRHEFFDWNHSAVENRWISYGCVDANVYMVSYTMRNNAIRIVSARKATRAEEEEYFNGNYTEDDQMG